MKIAAAVSCGKATAGFGAGSGPRSCLHFLFDRFHQRFGLGVAALRLKPAWRLRKIFAQIPDDQRADTGNDEHRTPSPGRDDQKAEDGGCRKSGHDEKRHEGKPAAARLRRHEFCQCRITDNDFGAEAKSLHETAGDQLIHVLRESRGNRGETKNEKVDLIREASTIFVADEAGDERADRHADKSQGEELQILRQRGEFGLGC